MPLTAIQQLVLPPTDPQTELAVDATTPKPGPMRFAVPRKVEVTPATSGTWEQLTNGRLWRLRIGSPGATDLNLGFSTYWLPKGASLYIISETEKYYQGPYTARHNAEHGQLWTPVVPGDAAVLELFVPASAQSEPQLVLSQVSTGYRDLFHRKTISLAKAGTCEIDVECPPAYPWANEVRSVACISINGALACSATLIMDAAGDFRPFLLTANHCTIDAGNAATVVAYWNYQSPSCGMNGLGGSLAQNTSGTTFRAAKADVDFCLVELVATPDRSYEVYYAGWDRSGNVPSSGVGIHHPNVDGTCISFSSSPFNTIDSCIGSGGTSTHWQVSWGNQGVTEPGSSGSGIWDASTHALVGTLSGGPSSCTAIPTDLWDCYGKFSVAWASGTSSADRLMDWLDPSNSGILIRPGGDPFPHPIVRTAGTALVFEGCYPNNGAIDPGETVTVNFSLRNAGAVPFTNLVATLVASPGVTSLSGPQSYGAIPSASSAARPFSFTASGNCAGAFSAILHVQDGTRDLGMITNDFVFGKPRISTVANFDEVTAPALPTGWTSSPPGVWYTTTVTNDTAPNSAFTAEPPTVSDQQLLSPLIPITHSNATLSFRHYYNLEQDYDGCVLEISIGGGPFMDILDAGGTFITGGYDTVISPAFGNPLGNRSAWSGDSIGFKTSTVNLPSYAAGQTVQFSWRLGTDNGDAVEGWYVDSIQLVDHYDCCVGTAGHPTLEALSYGSGKFQFTVNGTSGYPYAVEASADLINWMRLATNTAPFVFSHTNAAAFPMRFYRAVYQP